MTKSKFFLVALFLIPNVAFAGSISAPIDAVTVYQDRAQITRKAPLGPFQGRKTFLIKDITVEAALESFQVKTNGPVKIIAFTPSRYFKTATDNLDEKKLRDQYSKLIRELNQLKQEYHVNSTLLEKAYAYQDYLKDALGRYAVGNSTTPLGWQRGVDFVQAQSLKRAEETARLDKAIEKKRIECLDLIRKIEQIQTSNSAMATQVELFVEAKSAVTTSKVDISYMTPAATWTSHYDIKQQGKDKLKLSFFGRIQQRTGEDWRNAKITLATSRPDLGLRPPSIHSASVVGRVRDNKSVVLQTKEDDLNLDAFVGATLTDTQETSDGEAMALPKGLELDLIVSKRKTIAANYEPHQVFIHSRTLPVTIDRVAFPAIRPHVFMRAQGTNSSGFPLLPGRAHLLGDAGFLGKTQMPFTPQNGKFALSLGVAQDMRVGRQIHTKKQKRTTVGKKARTYRYTHSIWNFGKRSEEVVVIDTLPISNIDAVKIKLLGETTPKPTVDKKGQVEWKVTIKPGAHTDIKYAYNIRAPKKFVLPKKR